MSDRKRHGINRILFDDGCPMCVFQSRLITWLDWFEVARLVPISAAHDQGMVLELSPAQLREAIHCVAGDGRIFRGARCFRFIGLRIPLLVPLALVLWIPGVIWVAEIVYQWISRNRMMLSRIFGCKEACAVLPARRRGDEQLGGRGARASASPPVRVEPPRRA